MLFHFKMLNDFSKVLFLCSTALLFSVNAFAQVPNVTTLAQSSDTSITPSALQASPYSFDFESIEIDRVAQLIESIHPLDLVFAPNINLDLTSAIVKKETSLAEIFNTALKPHALQIRTLDHDLFWIESKADAQKPISFVRYQQALDVMPIELCSKKTTLSLRQLGAQNIQYNEYSFLEDFGKKNRIRAKLNNQQVQIYCMRNFDDVSAKIIVIGDNEIHVKKTLMQLIEAYQN